MSKKYTEAYKIQRRQITLIAPVFDPEKSVTGENNVWHYDRAPDGFKFELVSARITCGTSATVNSYGVIALFDGKVYNTRWDIFPGVEDFQLLGRAVTNVYQTNDVIDLFGWECKEYTVATRSTSTENSYIANIIIWYFLKPMSKLEKLMYAVLHPKRKYRKGGPSTVELTEA
jgi:hypothetical protein